MIGLTASTVLLILVLFVLAWSMLSFRRVKVAVRKHDEDYDRLECAVEEAIQAKRAKLAEAKRAEEERR